MLSNKNHFWRKRLNSYLKLECCRIFNTPDFSSLENFSFLPLFLFILIPLSFAYPWPPSPPHLIPETRTTKRSKRIIYSFSTEGENIYSQLSIPYIFTSYQTQNFVQSNFVYLSIPDSLQKIKVRSKLFFSAKLFYTTLNFRICHQLQKLSVDLKHDF